MALCGSFRCGCGVSSSPATQGAINGELPSIVVTGSGQPGDPYDLTLNDAWAAEVADRVADNRILAIPQEYVVYRLLGVNTLATTLTNVGTAQAIDVKDDRLLHVTLFAALNPAATGNTNLGVNVSGAGISKTALANGHYLFSTNTGAGGAYATQEVHYIFEPTSDGTVTLQIQGSGGGAAGHDANNIVLQAWVDA